MNEWNKCRNDYVKLSPLLVTNQKCLEMMTSATTITARTDTQLKIRTMLIVIKSYLFLPLYDNYTEASQERNKRLTFLTPSKKSADTSQRWARRAERLSEWMKWMWRIREQSVKLTFSSSRWQRFTADHVHTRVRLHLIQPRTLVCAAMRGPIRTGKN